MPAWDPTKRRDLVAGLRRLGFSGPFSGGKHELMVRSTQIYLGVDASDLERTIERWHPRERAGGRGCAVNLLA